MVADKKRRKVRNLRVRIAQQGMPVSEQAPPLLPEPAKARSYRWPVVALPRRLATKVGVAFVGAWFPQPLRT